MKMLIQNLHIFTTDGEENVLNFSNSLTFVYGNVGTGKSTMLNLIMYCLGGELTNTPAINKCLEAVQLEVKLDDRLFRFFRKKDSGRIQIDDVTRNQRLSILQRQISSFLYKQFSLPDLYLSMGNIEDRKVKLSFANFSWFSYLKQSEMDNNFFQLDSDNVYKQNAAINVLFSFLESDFLMDPGMNQKYREKKRLLRQYEDCNKVFEYIEKIFPHDDAAVNVDINAAIAALKQQIADVLSNPSLHSNSRDLVSLIEKQRKLDQLEYKAAFRLRQDRYFNKLDILRQEMADIVKHIHLDRSIDNPNLQQLYKLFRDCLVHSGFHGIGVFDAIRMDSKTYMPILYSPYENREVSFQNLGSGGKKTLFKICFALAVHRLQHTKTELNYLPSFLIIDTPMKNISEREDAAMYDQFYDYLFTLFSTELSDTQLIVVDKEKRDLGDYNFRKNVVLMRMTRDDWMNPPLFKYYKEL